MHQRSGIDHFVWSQHAEINRLQSVFWLVVMTFFFAAFGWFLWNGVGIIVMLMIGAAGGYVSTLVSPCVVKHLFGARLISPDQLPELWRVLEQLTSQADLPAVPKLYHVRSRMLNAFAVGTRQNPALVLSEGLIRTLSVREITGVLAHELSHIHNNDLWIIGLANMFSRMTTLMSWFGQILLLVNLPLILVSELSLNWIAIILMISAPNLSALAQLALSRTSEYNADLNAVQLTGDPDGLAGALAKIEQLQGGCQELVLLPGRRVIVPSFLRTHPETQERIRRLIQIKS